MGGGTDIVGNLFGMVANAIMSRWAFYLAIIGCFIGIASWFMGDHGGKGHISKVLIGSVMLLGLNQLVGWIHP